MKQNGIFSGVLSVFWLPRQLNPVISSCVVIVAWNSLENETKCCYLQLLWRVEKFKLLLVWNWLENGTLTFLTAKNFSKPHLLNWIREKRCHVNDTYHSYHPRFSSATWNCEIVSTNHHHVIEASHFVHFYFTQFSCRRLHSNHLLLIASFSRDFHFNLRLNKCQ